MYKKQFKKMFEKFTKGKNFKINPDEEYLIPIWKSFEISSKKEHMLWCPCRPRTGNKEEDLRRDLSCPCDFKKQVTWKTKGECWCALFVKR